MKLSQYESESALWKRIEIELNERLTVLREKNDGNLDQLETSKLRGTIAALKEILDWSKPSPEALHRDL
jgi:hypothetical protein